jgi:basic amino acid/polyamine antiporter, APA family
MGDARPIGRWKMTALVINCIIGSAIFGVPSEAIRMVGNLSPLAMIAAALLMGMIILPVAEVASQFSEAGGMYLYARTAFGRFVGLQVGWFWLLAIVGGGAAGANLFLTYLTQFLPSVAHGWRRVAMLLVVISIPTAANYVGVRQGANLSVLFTVAKAVPLALVIGLGLFQAAAPHGVAAQALPSSANTWPKLLLILLYAFSGWEDALVPSGEVRQPRRTIPFALTTGLLICAVVYTLFQLVVLQQIGTNPTARPVVETASALLGRGAGSFVAIAVMLSTYGWISGAFLNAPRFPVALAHQGDCPAVFGKLHPRFRTPSLGILLYGVTVLVLAVTGTFLWAIALTAGALTIFYAVTCAALIQLRRSQPEAKAFRVRFGRQLAVLGIAISAALLTQLELRQLSLMSVTALLAAGNWIWARANAARERQECHKLP